MMKEDDNITDEQYKNLYLIAGNIPNTLKIHKSVNPVRRIMKYTGSRG